jgi:hypothetical protein
VPRLPERPNLDHLRHEARTLLRSAKAGDPDAIERIRTFSDRITLSTAQFALAREYGLASWPILCRYVEELLRAPEVSNSSAESGNPSLGVLHGQMSEVPRYGGRPWYKDVARAGLERWDHFPVGADPRPLVLTGVAWRTAGFVDGASKRSFTAGAIKGIPGVPDEPVELLRRALRHSRVVSDTAFLVTHADRSQTEFWTDRGRRLLPAWRIESPNARGVVWVMDEATLDRVWVPPSESATRAAEPCTLHRATLFQDGVTLRLRFTGAPKSIVAYDGLILETTTAVCVIPVERLLKSIPRSTWTRTLNHSREFTVRLARPLGGRVLVSLTGRPLAVLPWIAK